MPSVTISAMAHAAFESKLRVAQRDPLWLRILLTGFVIIFLTLILLLPLLAVFADAFRKGWEVYIASLTDRDALSALKLTLLVAGVSVPINVIAGISVAWLVTRFQFKGKSLLITLIDLPFAVSPVVAGLIFVFVFGSHGWLPNSKLAEFFAPVSQVLSHGTGIPLIGGILESISEWMQNPKIIFSPIGVVIATVFVTFPFVARELIPLMQSQGADQEYAAMTLGAGGFRTFWKVTLPNIKWALFYGVILCNARAMGEFGAVSVVSGHLRNQTVTLPLQVEILYNEFNFSASFAVASLLAFLALLTLLLKTILEARAHRKNQSLH